MIYSYDLEQQLLAGLIKYPDRYGDIASFVSEKDFFSDGSKINRTLFSVLKQAIENGENIDAVILTQRLKDYGITFEDNSSPFDYIESLSLKKISAESVHSVAQELKKYTIRRELFFCGQDLSKKMRSIQPSASYRDIVQTADKAYNDQINLYEIGDDKPINIFDEMEELVEVRGENPVGEFGYSGPHPKVQSIYGSLLRPGNITVIVARSGVGKSKFCMDFASKASAEHGVPVLHFDNGEMSKEELIFRQCSAMSGVPIHLLESGEWRKAGKSTVEKVRAVWADIKERYRKMYYYNVGGLDVDAQIGVLKRFYYSEIGRGHPMFLSFDYIKTTSENTASRKEWEVVGEIIDKYKKTIQKDIVSDNGPNIAMITSVQSNRYGIVTNRNSANVIDDESIVSLSDRIIQFCSHMFILREKTNDELLDEPGFGTHKFINIKSRHLGRDIEGALNPVRMPDGALRKNFINLDMRSFFVAEKGDLRDIVRAQTAQAELEQDEPNTTNSLPNI